MEKISSIEKELKRFLKDHQNEDDWVYEPEVMAEIKRRVRQARKEYCEGKLLTAEQVFVELKEGRRRA